MAAHQAINSHAAIVHRLNARKQAVAKRDKMSYAQREAIARKAYENTWNQVASAYGAEGDAAPELVLSEGPTTSPGAEATTHWGEGGPRRVELSKGEVLALSRLPGLAKKRARGTLLHEWAHSYQTPEVLESGNDAELGANMFAEYYGKKILGIPTEPNWMKFPGFKNYVKKYGKGMWRRRQFGENYGKSTTEFE